jgi:translation initiation factor 2B subunit (eIF-2B alpha/beta/delta family)
MKSDDMIFQETLQWVKQELKQGRNDTVHDYLAYLAEQMIEMNKRKNEEIKGFLKWLEREIRTGIDTLTNKTAIKEYHDSDFNYLLNVLKKNKNKISVDPANRKIQETIDKNFNESLAVLAPLKEKIKATDDLIDLIVYELYGLTPQEIEIVEGKR